MLALPARRHAAAGRLGRRRALRARRPGASRAAPSPSASRSGASRSRSSSGACACASRWRGSRTATRPCSCGASALDAIGGVPQAPIMEDLDLVRALQRARPPRAAAAAAVTSARRYLERGVCRSVAQNTLALRRLLRSASTARASPPGTGDDGRRRARAGGAERSPPAGARCSGGSGTTCATARPTTRRARSPRCSTRACSCCSRWRPAGARRP